MSETPTVDVGPIDFNAQKMARIQARIARQAKQATLRKGSFGGLPNESFEVLSSSPGSRTLELQQQQALESARAHKFPRALIQPLDEIDQVYREENLARLAAQTEQELGTLDQPAEAMRRSRMPRVEFNPKEITRTGRQMLAADPDAPLNALQRLGIRGEGVVEGVASKVGNLASKVPGASYARSALGALAESAPGRAAGKLVGVAGGPVGKLLAVGGGAVGAGVHAMLTPAELAQNEYADLERWKETGETAPGAIPWKMRDLALQNLTGQPDYQMDPMEIEGTPMEPAFIDMEDDMGLLRGSEEEEAQPRKRRNRRRKRNRTGKAINRKTQSMKDTLDDLDI